MADTIKAWIVLVSISLLYLAYVFSLAHGIVAAS